VPYIKVEDRLVFEEAIQSFKKASERSLTPGDLNYFLTSICHHYLLRKGVSYTHLNDVVGVLESAKLEFYRRIISSYEDDKIKQNGDV